MATARAIPYHGQVASLDLSAQTFMVGKRTFKMIDQTQITREGAAATMADVTAGEKVSGSYWKKGGGALEAKSVKIRAKKGAAASTSSSEKKEGKARVAEASQPTVRLGRKAVNVSLLGD